MMGGCCSGWGLFGGVVGWLVGLVIVGAVIWFVFWLVRHSADASPAAPSSGHTEGETVISPKEALQLRYVRGEITREQYLTMLKDLE